MCLLRRLAWRQSTLAAESPIVLPPWLCFSAALAGSGALMCAETACGVAARGGARASRKPLLASLQRWPSAGSSFVIHWQMQNWCTLRARPNPSDEARDTILVLGDETSRAGDMVCIAISTIYLAIALLICMIIRLSDQSLKPRHTLGCLAFCGGVWLDAASCVVRCHCFQPRCLY